MFRANQTGFTLMELLVAVVVALIATSAMVSLLGNTMGAGTRMIEMTRLQQEMRATMQLLTRDLRRSSYNAEAIYCFGNFDCDTDGTFTGDYGFTWAVPSALTINGGNDCVIFDLDRGHDAAEDNLGGFRLEPGSNPGVIQMINAGNTASCAQDAGWFDVTDDCLIDVTAFVVCEIIDADDAECTGDFDGDGTVEVPLLSYDEFVGMDTAGNDIVQRVRKIQILMSAELVENDEISKTYIDRIRIRNDSIL